MSETVPQKLGKVIQIDEDKIQQHLVDLVRGTVEETLNKLLDAEVDQCTLHFPLRTKNTLTIHFRVIDWCIPQCGTSYLLVFDLFS